MVFFCPVFSGPEKISGLIRFTFCTSFIIQDEAERTPLFGKLINSKPKKTRQMFFLFLESTQNAVLHQRVFEQNITKVAALNIDTMM